MRETDLTKQESCSTSDISKNYFNAAASSSSTISWSRHKDPRIVRVSRTFGGKDRHSKVCTVRGLRDRRVRLSVPTAIQLYDLQDRLGLNQPSKVVDWLLNAAKHEIDELPPLQFPQSSLLPILHRPVDQSDKQVLTVRFKDVSADESWIRSSEEERQGLNQDNACVYAENLSEMNSFLRWDPSNLTLSQSLPPRSPGSSSHHHQGWHNFSLMPSAAQPYFHSQISAASNAEFDAKNLNFQSSTTVESCSLPARPMQLNITKQ